MAKMAPVVIPLFPTSFPTTLPSAVIDASGHFFWIRVTRFISDY